MSELDHAAAVITAAFINKGMVDSIPKAATEYFDCLARLNDEKKNRMPTGHPRRTSPTAPSDSANNRRDNRLD